MTGFTPEAFGKYFLVDKIATGGMAEIFKAKTYSHGGFEQLLVIKRILSHLGENEEFVEMFIDEAKVSVALQHANIIRIYDFGKISTNYFIAMEWVDGKDARNVLKKVTNKRQFLPVEFAAYIAHESCKGLDYAHRKTSMDGRPYGIVHRDVSPSNVLVSYEGDIKIADFGIAKAQSNTGNTKDGVLKGKFEYMSPEQANGLAIDHRSDIFSLGIILHEMLACRRLFKAESDAATLARIRQAEVFPPSQFNARVPKALDRIVLKALARDRDERYQSAKEMQEDLAQVLFPATPDTVRRELAAFMSEHFAAEIAEERRRLDEGSLVAEQLSKQAVPSPESWASQTNPSVTRTGMHMEPTTLVPWMLSGGLLLLLGVGVVGAVGLGTWWYLQPPPPPPLDEHIAVIEPVVPPAPVTGSLDILLAPGGSIELDGTAIGKDQIVLEGVKPGDHTVKISLEGYETLEESIHIDAGQIVRLRKTLTPIPVVAPIHTDNPTPRPPPVATAPGKVQVVVVGGGWAHIFVDGKPHTRSAPATIELPAGKHTIRLENAELGIDEQQEVDVISGASVRVSVRPQ